VDADGTFGWGVLGAAGVARTRFLPALAQAERARLVTVGARRLERAQELVDLVGAGRAAGSYEDVLADPEVDAVYVPLPNGLHREWVLRALEAGKHVLCEKSLVLSTEHVDEIAAAAERAGRTVTEGFMYRFLPVYDPATWTPLLERIGPVRGAQVHFSFLLDRPDDIRWDPALGGGALWDLGCYCLDLLTWQLGDVAAVTAVQDRVPGGVERATAAALRFTSGATATAWWSFAAARTQQLVLVGEHARLELDAPFRAGGTGEARLETTRPDRSTDVERWTPPGNDTFRAEIEHVQAVARGEVETRLPLAQSRRWIAVAEEIAGEQGR